MLKPFLLLVAVPMLAAAAGPDTGSAAEISGDSISPAERQRMRISVSLGTILHAYDRAASVSTDLLLTTHAAVHLSDPGGHIVEQAPDNRLRVTFYKGGGADARSFFVVEVADGNILDWTHLASPTPLTAEQAALATAREIADREAPRRGYFPCTTSPFRSVAIPSTTGNIGVYLLSARTSETSYPIGGHFRLVIAADGQIISARPFTATCLNLDVPKTIDRGEPQALFTTNRLDPVPNELYVFASHSLSMPLHVMTNDDRIWTITQSQMALGKANSASR